MLSRNLYEIDEVVASLQLCLRNMWPRALFWAWELFVSEEFDLLKTTLTDSWLDYGAPHDFTVFAAIQSIDGKSILTIVQRIIEAIRKTGCLAPIQLLKSAKRLHLTTSNRRPNKNKTSFATSELSTEDAHRFWTSLDSACRCYWFRDAFWLLQAAQPILSADTIWSAISLMRRGSPEVKAFLQSLQAATSHPISQIRHQAAAIATLCYSSKRHQELATIPLLPKPIQPPPPGRRQSRLYAISAEALHKDTVRGTISNRYTNIQDIREPILLLMQGCAWWRRVTEAAGFKETEETLEMPDDDGYEAFCDEFFPDDIPDEWSAADQQKSHGRGIAETAPEPESPWIREEPVSQREWSWGTCTPTKLAGKGQKS